MSNSSSLVSVIMTCYNGQKTLPMALASIFCQTYENWELIFVDDGSIDGSAKLVKDLIDPRIRVFSLGKNYGRPVAYQRGIDESCGEFITILDDDDWWYSTKLQKQIDYLNKHKKISLVGGGMMIEDGNGIPVGFRRSDDINFSIMTKISPPPLAFATICIRTEIAKKYLFNSKYKVAQDFDFLLRVCFNERFANLPELIYVYREYQSFSWQKMRQSQICSIQAMKSLQSKYSFQLLKEITKMYAKFMIYIAAHILGQKKCLIAHRSISPTISMLREYDIERKSVETKSIKITG